MRSADDRRAALQRGQQAEALVAEHLIGLGWTVLDQNWHGVGGELDIVAVRNNVLRFIEVKGRFLGEDALEAITASKQNKLRRTAEAWLLAHGDDFEEMAFTVAVVTFDPSGWQVALLDDAFDG